MANQLIGRQLGKYEIQAEIGRGGMGAVYLAYDPLLDRRVAIKVLAPHLVWEPAFVERFMREARAAARLKHAGIVTIYDVGQESTDVPPGHLYYIVMEYVDGQTLAAYIRQRGPLPPAEVVAILRPLADALDYAHQCGLIHRDIKPGNIMVGPSGQATLTDFGIARAVQETRLTTTGAIMGTPEYMSPEQAWGEEVDSRTDLYSLAVVAYEMLCGQVPFSGTTPHAVLYKQIHEPPPPIRHTHPELPAGLEAVLAQALSKEPGKRHPTVGAFVRALEQALTAASPAEAPTIATDQPAHVGPGRRPAAAREHPEPIPAGPSTPLPPKQRVPAEPPRPAPEPAPGYTAEPRPGPGEVHPERVKARVPPGRQPSPDQEPGAPQPVEYSGSVPSGVGRLPAKAPRQRRPLPRWIWVLGGLAILLLASGSIALWLVGGEGPAPTPTPTVRADLAAAPTARPQVTIQPRVSPVPMQTPALPPEEFSGPPVECTDPMGCVRIGGDDPIRIAYMLALSGPDRSLGIDALRAIELAVDDAGADSGGRILGHPIELVGQDTPCDEAGGERAALKLAADPQIVAVVGPSCSNSARAAIPVLCQARMSLISPSSTAPALTVPDRPQSYQCFLRTAQSDLAQGLAAARFVRSLDLMKAATIHDGSLYSKSLQEAFAAEFQKAGGQITAQEAIEPDGGNAAPALAHIAATHPQMIYYPLLMEAGGQVTRQARQNPDLKDIRLLGADGMFAPTLLEAAGETALGMFLTSPDLPAFGPEYERFLQRYREKYGEPPIAAFHAHAYDATMMILTAIQRVAMPRDDGSLIIGRQALREALFATRDFKGLTGNLTCNPHGDCADPRIAVFEIRNTDPASWNPGEGPSSNPGKIWP